MTRVIVVDDQALVREGIRTLLQVAGIDVVAEAGDGREALETIASLRPDVALLDLRMPRHDGIWTLEQLRERGIDVSREGDQFALVARDDGIGARLPELGNGLRGLRERFESLGGELTVDGTAGFVVTGRVAAE